jgi:hypothetical protein
MGPATVWIIFNLPVDHNQIDLTEVEADDTFGRLQCLPPISGVSAD